MIDFFDNGWTCSRRTTKTARSTPLCCERVRHPSSPCDVQFLCLPVGAVPAEQLLDLLDVGEKMRDQISSHLCGHRRFVRTLVYLGWRDAHRIHPEKVADGIDSFLLVSTELLILDEHELVLGKPPPQLNDLTSVSATIHVAELLVLKARRRWERPARRRQEMMDVVANSRLRRLTQLCSAALDLKSIHEG